MMYAVLLGSGGSCPRSTRPLTSAYLKVDGTTILIDCGEGTQMACYKAGVKIYDISVICLTHLHADHVLGLPGLLLSMDQILKANREHNRKLVTVIGPPSCKSLVHSLISAAPVKNLAVQFVAIEGNEQSFDFGSFVLKAYKVNHSVECYGYSVEEVMKPHFSLEKAESCGVGEETWKFLQAGYKVVKGDRKYRLNDITEGEPSPRAKIAYVTDTLVCDGVRKAVNGADLAIVEGMYFSDEDRPKLLKSMHMSFEGAATVAKEERVKRLWLTHFSPTITDPLEGLGDARKIFPETYCGKCGMKMEVIGGR